MIHQDAQLQETLDAQVRALIEAFNAHDIDRILAMFTDDAVWQAPSAPDPLVGRQPVAALLRGWFQAFPDFCFPPEDVVVYQSLDGTKGASHWRVTGTMTGPLDPPGFAATGRKFEVHGTCLYEFRDGRFSRHTIVYDSMDMLTQLGLMPAGDSWPSRTMVRLQRLTAKVRRR